MDSMGAGGALGVGDGGGGGGDHTRSLREVCAEAVDRFEVRPAMGGHRVRST